MIYQNRNTMTTQIKPTKDLTVDIQIFNGWVFVTTTYFINKRTTIYSTIEDAINETTLPSVRNFLKSI